MSFIALENVRRLRYTIETSASYGTNLSGTAQYHDMHFTSITPGTNFESVENELMVQNELQDNGIIYTRKRSSLQFESYLTSMGVAASGSQLPVRSPHSDMLKTILGGIRATSGSAITAVANAGTLTGSAAAADRFVGSIVGVLNTSTNRLECSRVQKFDSGIRGITLEHQLAFTPTASQTLYGANTVFCLTDPGDSLQFFAEGNHRSDNFYLLGMQGGFGLNFTIGEIAKINYDLQGSGWVTGSARGADELPIITYTGSAIPVTDHRFLFYQHSTASVPAFDCLRVSTFEITPNISYTDITTTCNESNILRKRRSRAVPIAEGTFTAYFQDLTYWQSRDLNVKYGMAIQLGSQPGKTVYISCPYVQITDVQRVGAEELAGVQVSFRVLDNRPGATFATAGNIDLAISPLSIGFL